MAKHGKNEWHKEYLKQGFVGLTETSLHMFAVLSRKYGKETYGFLKTLRNSFSRMRVKEMIPLVDAGLAVASLLGSYYDRLSGMKEPGLTKVELADLYTQLAHMTSIMTKIQEAQAEDAFIAKRIQATEKKHGFDLVELKRRHGKGMELTAKADTEKYGSWQRSVGNVLKTQDGLKSTLLSGVAGPFAPLVDAALGQVGKMMTKREDKKQVAKMQERISSSRLAAQELGEPSAFSQEGIHEFGRGNDIKSMLDGIAGRPRGVGRMGRSSNTLDAITGGLRSEMRSGAGATVKTLEQGLFDFYDNRALKAQWTRRVLAALEKNKSDNGGMGSFLDKAVGGAVKAGGSILSTIAGLLGLNSLSKWLKGAKTVKDAATAGLAVSESGGWAAAAAKTGGAGATAAGGASIGAIVTATLAVLAAGAAGYALGTIIRKIFPQVDEFLSGKDGVFTKVIEKTDKLSEKVGTAPVSVATKGIGGLSSAIVDKFKQASAPSGAGVDASKLMLSAMHGQTTLLASIMKELAKEKPAPKQAEPQLARSGSSAHHSEDPMTERMQMGAIGSREKIGG